MNDNQISQNLFLNTSNILDPGSDFENNLKIQKAMYFRKHSNVDDICINIFLRRDR